MVGGRKEVVQGQLYRTSAHASGEDLQGGPREDADGGERGVSAGGLENQEIHKDSASTSKASASMS